MNRTRDAGQFTRAMVVAAHPDDPEFGYGAVVARLGDEGVDLSYVICTDGSQGSEDLSIPDTELTATRYAEQRRAARILGVGHVVFLGFRDGQLVADLGLRRAIAREVRRFRPELVMTHLPLRALGLYISASHPDHVAVGAATLAAVHADAGSPRAHPELLAEGLAPHVVREVWLPGTGETDHY